MHNKLTRLVLITCFAFLGVISLQIYWLHNSYQEKCSKLKSDLSAAILSSQLTLTAETGVPLLKGPQRKELAPERAVLKNEKRDSSLYVSNERNIRFVNFLNKSADSGQNYNSNLVKIYHKEITQKLNEQGTYIPFVLALTDSDGHVIKSTIPARDFEAIPFKSDLDMSPVVLSDKSIATKIQIAVPNASHFLLGQILTVSLISTALILFCIASLTYMIALFFRRKKISEIRNDFTNNMTHELKTPISSATLALGMLRDDSLGLEELQKKEYFQIAENELRRLTLLVDKVLKMAAYEKGEIKVYPQLFLIKPWIESIVNPLKPILEANNARISVTIYPENLKIKSDKPNMSSVLQNLLDNAIKYSDRTKDHTFIQVEAWQNDTNYFLAVQDNGIGIPVHHQERIFDKFFRVPTGDEHETKGYGLGLSYVKQIIQLHGGNIELESTFHVGTRFKISIPKNH